MISFKSLYPPSYWPGDEQHNVDIVFQGKVKHDVDFQQTSSVRVIRKNFEFLHLSNETFFFCLLFICFHYDGSTSTSNIWRKKSIIKVFR